MESLRKSIVADFTVAAMNAANESDFASLRKLPDFQKLLADLEAKTKPAPPPPSIK